MLPRQPPIKGNRMQVLIDLPRCDLWTIHKERKVRFFDLAEARAYAKVHGFNDGIRIKIAVGYGLKARLVALCGLQPITKKKRRNGSRS